MPPRKRKAPEAEPPATPPARRVTRSVTRAEMRLTRSGSMYGSASGSEPGSVQFGAEKKAERNEKGVEQSKKKKVKLENEEKKEQEEDQGASSSNPGKTIVIERCNQGKSFKTRATEVKDGLKEKVPGIAVKVNPKKPRRGCFEIREEGGEKFISLLNMKRPFKPMMDLDIDKVISDIVDKINGQDQTNGQEKTNEQDTTNGQEKTNVQDTTNGQDINQ